MQRRMTTLPPEILLEEYRRILAEEPQVEDQTAPQEESDAL